MKSSVGYREGTAAYALRPLIVVESPFKARSFEERTRNIKLVMNICRLAVTQGFNPYASHLFFTSFLKDELADERRTGIELGLIWSRFAEEVWMVLRDGEDLANHEGMLRGLFFHMENRRRVRYFRTSDNGESLREVTMFQGDYRVDEQPHFVPSPEAEAPPSKPELPVVPEKGVHEDT